MPPVPPAKTTWQEKVRALLDERGISVRRLATSMGRGERVVRNWISGVNQPIRETAVIAQLAAALEVPADWLTDGREGAPPEVPLPQDLQALAKVVPAKYRRLAFAIADAETADWLLAQLDLYERARKRPRAT